MLNCFRGEADERWKCEILQAKMAAGLGFWESAFQGMSGGVRRRQSISQSTHRLLLTMAMGSTCVDDTHFSIIMTGDISHKFIEKLQTVTRADMSWYSLTRTIPRQLFGHVFMRCTQNSQKTYIHSVLASSTRLFRPVKFKNADFGRVDLDIEN